MSKFFSVLKKSKTSKARLGVIKTLHGQIKTPAFVPVATKGTLKALPPQFARDIGIQVSFVNTYHLVTHPGPEIIAKAGGIHKLSNLNFPLMSDSGGFQVFSLANSKKLANIRGEEQPLVKKITEDGVTFRSVYDGNLIAFTPEKSMKYQRQIGADLVMAFDECTYYPATHEYTAKAMERTHKWLKRCIKSVNQYSVISNQFKNEKNSVENRQLKTDNRSQALYGIIQGGTFEDLRKESAKFVTKQDLDGIAIGGVSVGETKREMRDQVMWVSDYLPDDKPVHLLGVGQIDDILDLVKYGIDTFDCVEPTRLARMGTLYQTRQLVTRNSQLFEEIDILKGKYKNDLTSLTEYCTCYCCTKYTKAYLHHLFKQREILGYTLATYHNLWFMEKLFEKIRISISKNEI